jgi:uncharacterized damage-inducible protein DinB
MTAMLNDTLAVQLRMNDFILRSNAEDVTHEESLVRAVPGSNNINWLVAHVVATRCAVLPALRQESVWSDEQIARYRRGVPLAEDAQHLPFDEILRAFRATQERILAGVASASRKDFDGPAPFAPGGGPETLGTLLMKIAIHEAYHLGQTGILRRVAGKPGVLH